MARSYSLRNPIEPGSRSFGAWFMGLFIPESMHASYSSSARTTNVLAPAARDAQSLLKPKAAAKVVRPVIDPNSTLKGVFDEVNPFNGRRLFDTNKGEDSYQIVAADGTHYEYTGNTFTWRIALATFFGTDARPESIVSTDNSNNTAYPVLTFKQWCKNQFGGWDSLYHYEEVTEERPDPDNAEETITTVTGQKRVWDMNEKAYWQIAAAFTVKPVILAWNLATFLPKTARNVVKNLTESLPLYIAEKTSLSVGNLNKKIQTTWNRKLPVDGESKKGTATRSTKSVLIFFFGLGALVMLAIHIPTQVVALLSRAIFSPLRSLEHAINYALSIKGHVGEEKIVDGKLVRGPNVGGYILVAILGAISLTVSIAVWATVLPFLISAAIPLSTALSAYAPVALVSAITSLSQLSIVTASIGAINAGLAPIAAFLTATFGPAIALATGYLSAYVTVTVVPSALALGVILGVALPTIGSAVNKVANLSSDRWFLFKNEAGVHSNLYIYAAKFINLFDFRGSSAKTTEPAKGKGPGPDVEMENRGEHGHEDDHDLEPALSPTSLRLVATYQEQGHTLDDAKLEAIRVRTEEKRRAPLQQPPAGRGAGRSVDQEPVNSRGQLAPQGGRGRGQ